jgi:hypothetical protein
MSGHQPIYEIRQTKGIPDCASIILRSLGPNYLGGHFARKHPSARLAQRGWPTGLPPLDSPEPVGINAASRNAASWTARPY